MRIRGDSYGNVLYGTELSDLINGGGGGDYIDGGFGSDRLYGGRGDDFIVDGIYYADYASDTIGGGIGDDYIHTGTGFDTVIGGKGNDLLVTMGGVAYGDDQGPGARGQGRWRGLPRDRPARRLRHASNLDLAVATRTPSRSYSAKPTTAGRPRSPSPTSPLAATRWCWVRSNPMGAMMVRSSTNSTPTATACSMLATLV